MPGELNPEVAHLPPEGAGSTFRIQLSKISGQPPCSMDIPRALLAGGTSRAGAREGPTATPARGARPCNLFDYIKLKDFPALRASPFR